MSALAWLLIGAGVTLIALGVRGWRKAGRTLDAILAEARREDPE
jgi:hypothetical protein